MAKDWKLKELKDFCSHHAMSCIQLSDYHFRIEDRIDVWPTNNRYSHLTKKDGHTAIGKSKKYERLKDLIKILNW